MGQRAYETIGVWDDKLVGTSDLPYRHAYSPTPTGSLAHYPMCPLPQMHITLCSYCLIRPSPHTLIDPCALSQISKFAIKE